MLTNEDGKPIIAPQSPTGTDTTEEPPSQSIPNLKHVTMPDLTKNTLGKKKKMNFGLSRDLFRQWFEFTRPKNASLKRKEPSISSNETLPFNVLEYILFVQNCFLCVFADDKDHHRLEMLFSVAILIFVYFMIIQTFFQGRKSVSKPASQAKGEFGGSLFVSAIEELFDLDLDKKQQIFDQQEVQKEEAKTNVRRYAIILL